MKRPRPTLRPHTAPHVVKARESASSRAAPKPKDLGKLLLEQFSTGATSAVKVQQSAHSAMDWLARHGGRVTDSHDMVSQLSKVGTAGKFPNNAERDTHRLVHRLGSSLAAFIEMKEVRMYDPSSMEESVQKLPMILPHQLCLALWKRGEDVFRRCLFGNLTDQEVEQFWNHVAEKCSWFAIHPAAQWPTRGRIASVGSYGDEVQAYRNSECGVISVLGWVSELSYLNTPLMRYFACAVWSEHHEGPNTYNDAIGHMVESFRSLLDCRNKWPWSESYLIAFTCAQGDLKWLTDRMNGFHNFRANEFCSRCFCKKNAPDVLATLPNFSSNPDQFGNQDQS